MNERRDTTSSRAVAAGEVVGVGTGNEVTLDFMDDGDDIRPQHYAFLVSEAEFDAIFGRIQSRNLTYWADPGQRHVNTINTRDGGRGLRPPARNTHAAVWERGGVGKSATSFTAENKQDSG